MRQRTIISAVLIVALGLVTVALVGEARAARDRGALYVSFLDVGQGDAILIETPGGTTMLIDGGSGRAVMRALGSRLSFFDRSIDVVAATHPDLDHIGGLPHVVRRYDVSHFFVSGVEDDGADSRALAAALAEVGLLAHELRRGMYLALDTDVYLHVLFPDRDIAGLEANTGSLVMRLVYGETSFLLTGDAPESIETYLVDLGPELLASTVLKLGHHGSRTSTGEAWVGYVAPEYAVVSAGCDNSYGHPHDDVLERLARYEVDVRDTCTHGTITFRSDGRSVRVE